MEERKERLLHKHTHTLCLSVSLSLCGLVSCAAWQEPCANWRTVHLGEHEETARTINFQGRSPAAVVQRAVFYLCVEAGGRGLEGISRQTDTNTHKHTQTHTNTHKHTHEQTHKRTQTHTCTSPIHASICRDVCAETWGPRACSRQV